MDIRTLVDTAKAKGLTFRIDGERIRVEAPSEPDGEAKVLLATLRDHKDEIRSLLLAPSRPPASVSRIDEGRLIAVLIESTVLGAEVWLAFDDGFDPGDGLVVFYPDEIPFLKHKDAQTLREIHKAKLVFGGGRIRQ